MVNKAKIKNYFLKKKLRKSKQYLDFDSFKFQEKNVLIVDSIIPEYNKDSGSRRLFELIKLMLKNNISVFLLADIKEYKYKSDYIEKFQDLGVTVYQPSIDKCGSLITRTKFIHAIAKHINFVWLHRPDVFDDYFSIIKKANANATFIYDMVDFHYLRLLREWEKTKIPEIKKDAENYLEIELNNCKNADVIVVISENDKEALKAHYNSEEKMHIIGNMHQFIKKDETFVPVESRQDLLFVGSFRHKPNVDTVFYLKEQIMPLVWQEKPEIVVNIVGSYTTNEIQSLHSEKFNIVGYVEDITGHFKTAKLFVAPLQYGAGIKGKIGQSLEHSLPLVTTDVGAEGFDFLPYAQHVIANNPMELASKIIELYTNVDLWNTISNHSEKVLEPFSINTNERNLKQIFKI